MSSGGHAPASVTSQTTQNHNPSSPPPITNHISPTSSEQQPHGTPTTMLQAISHEHDSHYVEQQARTSHVNRHSIAALQASQRDDRVHLLLAASGSVATIKLPLIARKLTEAHPRLSIRVLLTPSAARFLAGQSAEQPPVASLLDVPGVDAVYTDEDEWREPWTRGAGILHIELRRWADMLVVAPLSANTLAKIVGGFADGILTSVVRAWDARGELDSDVPRPSQVLDADESAAAAQAGTGAAVPKQKKKKRIIVAPAMNTAMWRHPVTEKQIRMLEKEWGVGEGTDGEAGDGWFEVLRPQEKLLACGDIGDGAMKEWTEVVAVIEDRLGL